MIKLISVFQETLFGVNMSVDWRLLGEGVIIQSVPRLLKRYRVQMVLPEERTLYGSSLSEFNAFMGKYEDALRQLFQEFGVSWKDVYLNSDVGKERLKLAEKMGIGADDNVLDVGCGRGYFTAAAAYHTKSVVGLDLMNGLGRRGWWQKFKLTMRELHLQSKVAGVKGNVVAMPFKDETFSMVASVHAIRNFLDIKVIQAAFKEMKRVTQRGGRVIVVESLPTPKTRAQEAHLKMFKCKVKYTRGDMSFLTERELTDLLEKAGLTRFHIKTFDFNLSAAPPFFLLNTSILPEEQRAEAENEYNEAVEAVKKWGEASPPALFAEAIVG